MAALAVLTTLFVAFVAGVVGWKLAAVLRAPKGLAWLPLPLALLLGFLLAKGTISSWVDAQYRDLQQGRNASIALGNLTDFLPVLRTLGGAPSPELTEYLRRRAGDDPDPCVRVLALKALDQPQGADLVQACGASRRPG